MNYLDWYYSISQAHTPSRPVVWNVVHGKSEVERRGKKDKESEREAKRKGQEGKRETETERQRKREGQREAKDRTRTWEKERGSDSHLTEKGRALFLFHMLWSQKRCLLSFVGQEALRAVSREQPLNAEPYTPGPRLNPHPVTFQLSEISSPPWVAEVG